MKKIELYFEPRSGQVTKEGIEDLKVKSKQIGEAIGFFCKDLFDNISTSAGKILPNEVTIEFGVSAEGKKKLIIVEGSVKGHIKVSAKWKIGDQ